MYKKKRKVIKCKPIPVLNDCRCGSGNVRVVRMFCTWYHVECLNCFNASEFCKSEMEAAELWNKEVGDI